MTERIQRSKEYEDQKQKFNYEKFKNDTSDKKSLTLFLIREMFEHFLNFPDPGTQSKNINYRKFSMEQENTRLEYYLALPSFKSLCY